MHVCTMQLECVFNDKASERMVKRCVAAGCSNDGVSLFLFPKDPQLRKKWADQVKRTRDKWDGPTDNSILCSCFKGVMKLAISLGVKSQKKP